MGDGPAGRGDEGATRRPSWWRRRLWALLAFVALEVSGLFYVFLWPPVVRHGSYWLEPRDLWITFQAAHWVGWGDLANVYTVPNFIVTPGIAVALAPVAWLSSWLNLSQSYPFSVPHPTATVILAPTVILLGGVVLFALDAFAERLGVTGRRRAVLAFAELVLLWPVVVYWGHPELTLALAFALWGALALGDRRWAAGGWMLGVGAAFQPVVALLAPLWVAFVPRGQRLRTVARVVVPAAALLAIPLAKNWSVTTTVLVHQTAIPSYNHPTPWLSLAPTIQPGRWVTTVSIHNQLVNGHHRFVITHRRRLAPPTRLPGPARALAVAFAVALGFWVWRRPPTTVGLLWLSALAFSAWCFFEPVMVAYYPWPALALLVLLAARAGPWRLATAVVVAAAATRYAYQSAGPWAWWLPEVVMLAGLLALAWPGRAAFFASRIDDDQPEPEPLASTPDPSPASAP